MIRRNEICDRAGGHVLGSLLRGQRNPTPVYWLDLLVFGGTDLRVQSQHLRAQQLLDRLHGSQRLHRQLCGFVQRQLRIGIEVHAQPWSEWKRFVHRELDLLHHLYRLLLGELLFGVDL